jgi:hypothetical protein
VVFRHAPRNSEESSPEPGDLFDLALADWDTADVTAIRLSDASGELALAKAVPEEATSTVVDEWVIQGQEGETVHAERVAAFLTAMESLIAGNVVLQPKDTQLDQPQWSLEVTLAGGRDYRLDMGGPQGTWGYYVRLKGEDTVFLLDVEAGNRLMALGQELRSEEAR